MTKDEIVEFFKSRNIDVNTAKSDDGTTLLMLAASGDIVELEILLSILGLIDDKDFKNMTLVRSNVFDVVNALLDCGADVNAKDSEGWTALMYAVSSYELEREAPIIKLLFERGADSSELAPDLLLKAKEAVTMYETRDNF